jgi:PilZ domain-containing protein
MEWKVHRASGMLSRPTSTNAAEDLPSVGYSFHPERRKRARLQVQWPLRFRCGPESTIIEAITGDLSSDGFYCVAPSPFVPGEVQICTLSVPANHPDDLSLMITVQCRVRVVRVEVLAERGAFGIGCHIEDYCVHLPADANASESALAANG